MDDGKRTLGFADVLDDVGGSLLARSITNDEAALDALLDDAGLRDLYPGEAKTDRIDAFVIADTARTRRTKVHWLDTAATICSISCGCATGSTSTLLPMSPGRPTDSVTCSFRCHQPWSEPSELGFTKSAFAR